MLCSEDGSAQHTAGNNPSVSDLIHLPGTSLPAFFIPLAMSGIAKVHI
jgi:hypothetical protein